MHAPRDPRAAKLRNFRHGVIGRTCRASCRIWPREAMEPTTRRKDAHRPHALDLTEVEPTIAEAGLGIHSLYWRMG